MEYIIIVTGLGFILGVVQCEQTTNIFKFSFPESRYKLRSDNALSYVPHNEEITNDQT